MEKQVQLQPPVHRCELHHANLAHLATCELRSGTAPCTATPCHATAPFARKTFRQSEGNPLGGRNHAPPKRLQTPQTPFANEKGYPSFGAANVRCNLAEFRPLRARPTPPHRPAPAGKAPNRPKQPPASTSAPRSTPPAARHPTISSPFSHLAAANFGHRFPDSQTGILTDSEMDLISCRISL
eukprot:COSAG02_NODE_628_length_19343_cov_15.829297_12_plen_183_part_00